MTNPDKQTPDHNKWDPAQYGKFADERARPAMDLMAQIPLVAALLDGRGQIIDLGCGAGHQAAALADRFPMAQVLGIDSSAEMLEQARTTHGETERSRWRETPVEDYTPDIAPDLIYSNAALQWVGGHETLFPRLASWLKPGGVLAVQMPNNFDAPSHQIMRDAADNGPWTTRLAGVRRDFPVRGAAFYYAALAPHARHLDIWETTYIHVLEGADPVAQWTKSTGLRPYLSVLKDDAERDAFFEDYAARLRKAYPPEPDGRTLFPFRRLFMVAVV
ncbi:MAG: methyltransferase domain-containing protein [Alphaproteobacteria bacterium]|nr:methyltransferase domain-containing protein [Alphaproteobacteria bacterium]